MSGDILEMVHANTLKLSHNVSAAYKAMPQ